MTVPTNSIYANGDATRILADQLNTNIQVVSSIAALRSFIGISNIVVFTQGQGLFTYVIGSATDDNVNIIVPNVYPPAYWSKIKNIYAAIDLSNISSGLGRINLDFGPSGTGIGHVMAFGGNSSPNTFVKGLQIGGGSLTEGADGTIINLEGHATWEQHIPSKNYSSMELAVHTTDATGQAKTLGTNQLVWQDTSALGIIGSSFDFSWVGRKIYFNENVYLISAFVNSTTLTLTTLGGGNPNFPTGSPITEIFTVCFISGTGYCNVAPSGANSVVTWVSGDPFLVYATASNFQFYVNGTLQTVVSNNGIKSYTVSGTSLGTLTNATYNYYYDVNDQITTFRLHRCAQDIENLAFYTRYDGNYIEAQGGNVIGSYRNIYLTSGVIGGTTSANTKARQIVIGKNGNLSLGGDGTQAAITLTNPANPLTSWANFGAGTGTYSPSLQMRGSNTNANLNIDLQGTSSSGPYFEITCNNYGTSIQRLYPQSGSYINSDLTIYNKFYIKGPAGNYRGIQWATSASDYSGPIDRFEFVIDNSSESGSNAGSNLQLNAFSDTGSFLNTVFSVSRQTQVVNFAKPPIMPTPYYATLAALVSALPPSGYPYQTALIGDALSPTIGSTATGGGSVKCRVFSDGANYRIG